MNKHTKRKLCGLLALIAVNIAVIMALSTLGTSYAATTYKKGSSGDVVKTIQTKLKRWGYYTGDVDGIYGSLTVKAVKYFQGKNGLSADGVCGSATLKALGISSDSSGGGSSTGGGSSGSGSSNQSNDLYLMSRMISAEARGEPYIGQVAVGAVILNRVDHPSFPNTISGVIYQPGAFSAHGHKLGTASLMSLLQTVPKKPLRMP